MVFSTDLMIRAPGPRSPVTERAPRLGAHLVALSQEFVNLRAPPERNGVATEVAHPVANLPRLGELAVPDEEPREGGTDLGEPAPVHRRK